MPASPGRNCRVARRLQALCCVALLGVASCADEAPKDPVPAQIQSIEGTAEDAYDQALAGHPDLVAADA